MKHTPLAKSVGDGIGPMKRRKLNLASTVKCRKLNLASSSVKFSQYEPRITNCNSPNVVPIHIIQVFWRWRNMVLAINTITSISLVAVGMVSIEL